MKKAGFGVAHGVKGLFTAQNTLLLHWEGEAERESLNKAQLLLRKIHKKKSPEAGVIRCMSRRLSCRRYISGMMQAEDPYTIGSGI